MASKASVEHGKVVRVNLLTHVLEYSKEHGRPPTTRDLAALLELSLTRTGQLIEELLESGLLQRQVGMRRTLQLTDSGLMSVTKGR